MQNNFELDIARLSSNAAAILDRARTKLAREFATIDRLQAAPKQRVQAATRYQVATQHDLAQNNPLLRKLLRDLQTGRL
jgi:Tfp pilus assembly protein PilN